MKYILKIILYWFIFVFEAILNGIFREEVLNNLFDEKVALILSGICLILIISITIYFIVPGLKHPNFKAYIFVGFFWLILTLIFEYSFGYYVLNKSFSEINEIYNIADGNLFSLVLLITAFLPLIMGKYRKLC